MKRGKEHNVAYDQLLYDSPTLFVALVILMWVAVSVRECMLGRW
jgi:hypothetical protein